MSYLEDASAFHRNDILSAIPEDIRALLPGRLLTKPISSGEILYSLGSPLIYLIFPLDGVVSLQAKLDEGRTVEEGSIGREGVIGVEYILGERMIDYDAVVTIAGTASWLAVSEVDAFLKNCPQIANIFQAYIRQVFNQMRCRTICGSVHSAAQRIATWLLCAQDRTGANQFELTQRTLAGLFGLRLATISDASSRLSAAGAIDQTRGTLTILDRAQLEAAACTCYGRMRWKR